MFKNIAIFILFERVIKIKINEFIFYQGSLYEGIYFVINEMLPLKSNRNYNELDYLNIKILNILESKNQRKENLIIMIRKKQIL